MNTLITTDCADFDVHSGNAFTHSANLLAEGFLSQGSNLGKTPKEKHIFEESDSC